MEGKTKTDLIMQLADLCLYAMVMSKSNPENLAFQALVQNQRLIDSVLQPEYLSSMGIKYYYFDQAL